MTYLLFTVLCTGLRPSRIRPVRCSPADRHNIARVLIWDNGPVKVLLVPSEEQRQTPIVTLWELVVEGGLDPVRRGNAPKAAQPGNYGGIESNFGWDKWRWGKHMCERLGLVSICPSSTPSYSRELKIDSNH